MGYRRCMLSAGYAKLIRITTSNILDMKLTMRTLQSAKWGKIMDEQVAGAACSGESRGGRVFVGTVEVADASAEIGGTQKTWFLRVGPKNDRGWSCVVFRAAPRLNRGSPLSASLSRSGRGLTAGRATRVISGVGQGRRPSLARRAGMGRPRPWSTDVLQPGQPFPNSPGTATVHEHPLTPTLSPPGRGRRVVARAILGGERRFWNTKTGEIRWLLHAR